MGRWEPNARGRLTQAALELYVERGFEQTTVAEIAKLAGLTQRTFFRYFSDKREVLFWGSAQLQELLVRTVLNAEESAAPIIAVASAIEAGAELLQERRQGALLRHRVISANRELQERELIKLALLGEAITDALRQRGVPEIAARLSAETGITVFKIAFERWIVESKPREMKAIVDELLNELKVVTGEI
ncbi:MAG: TetR family transcriptional regulator [Acidimicrobiaceae bacterium]|nr:TetR family transcriptional regulator [Acidimicrobiaceae bacterium]